MSKLNLRKLESKIKKVSKFLLSNNTTEIKNRLVALEETNAKNEVKVTEIRKAISYIKEQLDTEIVSNNQQLISIYRDTIKQKETELKQLLKNDKDQKEIEILKEKLSFSQENEEQNLMKFISLVKSDSDRYNTILRLSSDTKTLKFVETYLSLSQRDKELVMSYMSDLTYEKVQSIETVTEENTTENTTEDFDLREVLNQ